MKISTIKNQIEKSKQLKLDGDLSKALFTLLDFVEYTDFSKTIEEKDVLNDLCHEIYLYAKEFRLKFQSKIENYENDQFNRWIPYFLKLSLEGSVTSFYEELGIFQNRRKIAKVAIVGDSKVGKRSLADKFLGEGFKQDYSVTIGATFKIKRMMINNREFTLQIWLMAGQKRFTEVRQVYYSGSKFCILIFDITNRDSFESIPKYADELMANNHNKIIPIMLIGNKADMRHQVENSVTHIEGSIYAKELSNWLSLEVPYYETSIHLDKSEAAFEEFFRSFSPLPRTFESIWEG